MMHHEYYPTQNLQRLGHCEESEENITRKSLKIFKIDTTVRYNSIDIDIGVVPWPPTKNDVMMFEFSVSIDVHRFQLFQN